MRLLLANPAGLWALAAIPLVVLIHFLQEKSRRVRTSTLFLLDRVKPESVGGARIERLRQSAPLWLQLLSVTIIAWLLAEPRWIREDSRQTVVVVLDSSVSMSAFRQETRSLLRDRLARWAGAASRTDWFLLETAIRAPRLYTGTELAGLLDAFDQWRPLLGTHAPDGALLTARGLARGGAGTVLFVTDHRARVPADTAVLSAGTPLENVGFAGGDARPAGAGEGLRWRAIVRNYGRERQEREWWIEDGEHAAPGARRRLQIEPGQTLTLEGGRPPGVERLTVVLAGDGFDRDDRLPLQAPQARMVRVALQLQGPAEELLRRVFAALDGVEMDAARPDLVVNELGTQVETNAIQLGATIGSPGSLDPAWVAAEDHRLTRDLAWSGLLTGRPTSLALAEGDAPLLWKGDRPLALLRPGRSPAGRPFHRLILNWDLSQSNAARLPALPVLLQRFVELVREGRHEPWAGNFETGQDLPIARPLEPAKHRMELRAGGSATPFEGRAPEEPGFFEVIEGGRPLLRGAAHFADTREADFREAESFDTSEARRIETAMRQSEADPWSPLWILLVIACLLASWTRRLSPAPASRDVTRPRPLQA